MDTIIRGGTLVTAEGSFKAELGIKDGRIVAVGEQLSDDAAGVVLADGLLIMPGGVDPHTHVDLPVGDNHTADDFFTATVAAALGGTTTLVDMAIPTGGDSPPTTIGVWDQRAKRSAIDYSYHVVLTHISPSVLEDVTRLAAEGLTSLKIYMPFEGLMLNERDILTVMELAKSLGLVVTLHCENETIAARAGLELMRQGRSGVADYPDSRPVVAERLAIEQAIALGEAAKCAVYIVHVTTADGVRAIRRARARGLPVYGETCPHYLLLDESRLKLEPLEAVKYFTGPPLRPPENNDALWNGLLRGDLQVVATDHCAWMLEQKRARIAFDQVPVGLPGLETRLALLFSEAVVKRGASPSDFVRWTSTNPSKIFGAYPVKGSLAVGADADIVLWDPSANAILQADALHQGSDYCPFEGVEVRGLPVMTFLRGQVVAEQGAFKGAPGMGRKVVRTPHPEGRVL